MRVLLLSEKSSLRVNGRGKRNEEVASSLKVVMMTATADFVELLIRNLLIIILHRHCTESIYMH